MSNEPPDPATARSVNGQIVVSVHDETDGALALLGRDGSSTSSQTPQEWASIVVATLSGEGVAEGNLEVFIVDEERIADLNSVHMGKQGPTDVLAFPIDGQEHTVDEHSVSEHSVDQHGTGIHGVDIQRGEDELASVAKLVPDEEGSPVERHLGDVVICASVANAQAPDHAGSFDAEMSLLIIHGVLHILGHDHFDQDEALVMQQREQHHLALHGFSHPNFPAESQAG